MSNEYDFTIKVKNCPFCGNPPIKKIDISYDVLSPYISCKHCGYRIFGDGGIRDMVTMEEAIIAIAKVVNKWNRRV